jgi:stress response protein YsnF
MRTVVALLDGMDEAKATMRDLQRLGIDERRINLVTKDTRNAQSTDLVDGLVRMGVPKNEAVAYADGVRQGYTLETAIVEDDKAQQALEVMREHAHIDERTGRARTERLTDAKKDLTGKAIPIVEEKLEVGKREVETGGVRVSTHVISQPVAEEITLRSERVDVQRRRVDRPIEPGDEAFRDQVVEVTAKTEEPVVAKTARVVEEVVVTKDVDQRSQTIRDNVRKTDVNVEKLPGYEADRYRQHFNVNRAGQATFEEYEPAYRFGHRLRGDERFAQYDDWSEVEESARTTWERDRPGTWDRFKAAIRHAWEKATD